MPGKVKVRILAGRNLPVMDRSSDTTDAYVEVKLASVTFKTEVFRKSLNPQWNSEWFIFEVRELGIDEIWVPVCAGYCMHVILLYSSKSITVAPRKLLIGCTYEKLNLIIVGVFVSLAFYKNYCIYYFVTRLMFMLIQVDDQELQDEPLQIRLMDHDTYSANDAIGKVYVDLNPLLLPPPMPPHHPQRPQDPTQPG